MSGVSFKHEGIMDRGEGGLTRYVYSNSRTRESSEVVPEDQKQPAARHNLR